MCEDMIPEDFLSGVISLFINHCILHHIHLYRGLTDYIRRNINKILDIGGEEVWKKWDYWTLFIQLDKSAVEEYENEDDEANYLGLIVKYGETISGLYEYLLKEFDISQGKEELDRKISKILKKDKSGLTFVDYAFHRRRAQIINLVEETVKNLNSDNLTNLNIPSLLKIYIAETEKTKEELEIEEKLFEQIQIPPYEMEDKTKQKFISICNYFADLSKTLKGAFYRYFKHPANVPHTYVRDDDSIDLMRELCKEEKLLTVDVEFTAAEDGMGFIANSLQISSPDHCFFIDCLILKEKARPLLVELLEDVSILKVFHGCEADLDCIYRTYSVVVRNIYDTARASLLLHDIENMPGLNGLSEKYINVNVDKSFQRAIWRVRPLPLPMLEYALTDAVILLPIFYSQWVEISNREDKKQTLHQILLASSLAAKSIKRSDRKFYFN